MSENRVGEAVESSAANEEQEAVIEKGEQGRSQRDMQNVTTSVTPDEPRVPFDPRNLDRAIDILVKVREMGHKGKTGEKPNAPVDKIPLKAEDMENTGETKAEAEKYLQAAQGDLQTAVLTWIRTPSNKFDFDSVYARQKSFLGPAAAKL